MKLNESIDLMRIANEWNQSEIGTDSEPDFDGNSQQDTMLCNIFIVWKNKCAKMCKN